MGIAVLIERCLSEGGAVRLVLPAQGRSGRNHVTADIVVRLLSAGKGVVSLSAFVERINLQLSIIGAQAVDSLPFEVLQTIINAPLFDSLCFETRVPDGP